MSLQRSSSSNPLSAGHHFNHDDNNIHSNDERQKFLPNVCPRRSSSRTITSCSIKRIRTSNNNTNNNIITTTTTASDDENQTSFEKRRALFLYSLTTILLFADQNLLAPNLTAIATEFGFDDIERDEKLGGHIALAFFIVGAPMSFVVGALADQHPSRRAAIFSVMVLIGEGACFATYFTTTYRGLFVTRVLTGFSVGGALPIVYSLLGDWFAAEERAGASASISVGLGVGIALGQAVAGYLGPTLGWRVPFLVVSVPALITAGLVLVLVRDPTRGQMERAVLERGDCDRTGMENYQTANCTTRTCQKNSELVLVEPSGYDTVLISTNDATLSLSSSSSDNNGLSNNSTWKKMRSLLPSSSIESLISLLKTRTVLLLLLQGGPGCLPWGVVNAFLNDYLAEDRGMTVEVATTVILVFGVGVFLGMVISGYIGNKLYVAYSPKLPPLIGGLCTILATIPFYLLINTITSQSSVIYTIIISILPGIFSGITGPIVKSTLTNVTEPSRRGMAFALLNTFDDFGRGLGPLFIAVLVKYFHGDRTKAFSVAIVGWFFCGILNALVYFTVEKDEEEVQRKLTSLLYHDSRDASIGSDDTAASSKTDAEVMRVV